MKWYAVVFLTVLVGAPSSASAVGPAAGSRSRAQFRNFLCQRALDPTGRSISVEATMRPLPDTQKMAIRFELLSRSKAAPRYTLVHGGDLGSWLSPVGQPSLGQRPGDVWSISHPVTNLMAPAIYRYRLTFRWIGKHGHLLGVRTLLTPRCTQPELRPDLRVASIAVQPVAGDPTQNEYIALIENAGATAAGPFQVVFEPGAPLPAKSRTVQQLRPGGTRQETFVGPPCKAAAEPTISVDPSHLLDDFDISNNVLRASCPVARPSL